ncbi:hypothetical protein [Pusillimonas noertemannii]|uniref:Mll5186 protein n=1 Tax=Pusillimonas noertemannii TaxID=305977 RepID=A0A2U1CRR7_9BURK|nr:hypothetical protein [Pusillimonas noertemannii]NYT67918.1 hypothetical protein [Pusillimonas noertemannii]PVY68588.1 hypothetical protein C7440_0995 [Pusillimonas noertemannii]TFL11939.1 hypothetical protein CSC72_02080 [Pusillimonas noertemannii]
MQRTEPTPGYASNPYIPTESTRSAVSWGAVIAGAVIAAALSAMLITGGTGLGFLAVSPWENDGASGTTLAVGTIIWLFVSQIISYAVAGYVAGRLRTKWADARGDEIYFRDTAHGFLVWALSFVVALALLGSTAASIVSGTARAGASMAQTGTTALAASAAGGDSEEGGWSLDYFADALLRPNDVDPSRAQGDVKREVSVILGRSVAQGEISGEDKTYLTRIIAQRAGVSEAQAQERLDQVTAQAKQAADEFEAKAREAADAARKAAAALALWIFASLLVGAFVASLAATMGGRARDL